MNARASIDSARPAAPPSACTRTSANERPNPDSMNDRVGADSGSPPDRCTRPSDDSNPAGAPAGPVPAASVPSRCTTAGPVVSLLVSLPVFFSIARWTPAFGSRFASRWTLGSSFFADRCAVFRDGSSLGARRISGLPGAAEPCACLSSSRVAAAAVARCATFSDWCAAIGNDGAVEPITRSAIRSASRSCGSCAPPTFSLACTGALRPSSRAAFGGAVAPDFAALRWIGGACAATTSPSRT